MRTLTMSGRCYSQAIEGSDVPREESWPVPECRKVGRGHRYTYTVDDETAGLIVSHVQDLYDAWFGYEDAARDRADLREFLRENGGNI